MYKGVVLALAVLLLAGLAQCEQEREYEECENSNDCTDKKYPICRRYFRDETFNDPENYRFYGFCGQCETSCDCGVGFYCARDFEFPELEPKNNNLPEDDPVRDAFNDVVTSYRGLKFNSFCKKIDIPSGDAFANVAPVRGESDDSFCGIVGSYQPDEIPCIGDDDDCVNLENPTARQPGFCQARVFRDGTLSVIGGCSSTLTLMEVTTEEPQWVGIAAEGRCHTCAEGTEQCVGTGHRQICLHNKWAPYVQVDGTIDTWNDNTVAQELLVVTLGIIIILAVMCFFGFRS